VVLLQLLKRGQDLAAHLLGCRIDQQDAVGDRTETVMLAPAPAIR